MEYFSKVVEYFPKVMEYFLRVGPYCQNVVRERTGQGCFVESGLRKVRNFRTSELLLYIKTLHDGRTGMRIIFREKIGAEFVRNPAPIVGIVMR